MSSVTGRGGIDRSSDAVVPRMGRGHPAIAAWGALFALALWLPPPGHTQTCLKTTPIGPGHDVGTAVLVQPDGKIVHAGYADNGTDDDFAVVRYNANFTLDPTFDSDGIVTTPIGAGDDQAEAIALQADGKIVVAGFSFNGANNDFAVVRSSGNHERLGDAVLAAQATYADEGVMPELLGIYHLLADPGMRIR